MNTKKIKALAVLIMSIMAAFCLTACGFGQQPGSGVEGAEDKRDGQGDLPIGQEEKNLSGYLFEINGITLGVDMDMKDIVPRLGEAKSVFEVPSCAAEGISYIYRYAGFEVETYPDGESSRIAYIVLKDDTVATAEGIDLSKTREDIIKAYGEGSAGGGSRLSYEKDGMRLNFIFNGEDIVSIEYVSGAVL